MMCVAVCAVCWHIRRHGAGYITMHRTGLALYQTARWLPAEPANFPNETYFAAPDFANGDSYFINSTKVCIQHSYLGL